jgi:hypothetical protein
MYNGHVDSSILNVSLNTLVIAINHSTWQVLKVLLLGGGEIVCT